MLDEFVDEIDFSNEPDWAKGVFSDILVLYSTYLATSTYTMRSPQINLFNEQTFQMFLAKTNFHLNRIFGEDPTIFMSKKITMVYYDPNREDKQNDTIATMIDKKSRKFARIDNIKYVFDVDYHVDVDSDDVIKTDTIVICKGVYPELEQVFLNLGVKRVYFLEF